MKSDSIDDILKMLRQQKCPLKLIAWTFNIYPMPMRTFRDLSEQLGEWLLANYGPYQRDFEWEYENVHRLKKLSVTLLGKNDTRTIRKVHKGILRVAAQYNVPEVDIEANIGEGFIEKSDSQPIAKIGVIEDGQLYQSFPLEFINSYLKLYANGDFMLFSTIGPAEQISKSLRPTRKEPAGKYEINGNKLVGKITHTIPQLRNPDIVITIRGTFTNYGIMTKEHSTWGNSRNSVKYKRILN